MNIYSKHQEHWYPPKCCELPMDLISTCAPAYGGYFVIYQCSACKKLTQDLMQNIKHIEPTE